jgi:hypothetical protein
MFQTVGRREKWERAKMFIFTGVFPEKIFKLSDFECACSTGNYVKIDKYGGVTKMLSYVSKPSCIGNVY